MSRAEQDNFASLATMASVLTMLSLKEEPRAPLYSFLNLELLSPLAPAGSCNQLSALVGRKSDWLTKSSQPEMLHIQRCESFQQAAHSIFGLRQTHTVTGALQRCSLLLGRVAYCFDINKMSSSHLCLPPYSLYIHTRNISRHAKSPRFCQTQAARLNMYIKCTPVSGG